MDCFTCSFEGMCDGVGNCSYDEYNGICEKCPIEKMEDLLIGATMSKFLTVGECKSYKNAIMDCIKIMKDEG